MISTWLATIALALAPAPVDDGAPAKVNYQDNVAAIFQARCNACHNGDKQKGGLSLDSYGGLMRGGGSGAVVEAGDPGASYLYQLVTHAEQPNMPPDSPKIPDAELEVIRAWIEGGALETSGSAAVAKAKPRLDFKLDPSAVGKPAGPPAMPEALSTEPVVVSARPNAITAIAASPWAPLVAVAGHRQVLLYETTARRLVAVLPFPEGVVHVLRFTRDGAMLLAAGGRGGQSGRVVLFDVKTGARVFEVGKEYDTVLAADVSPDRSLVALGGPSKVLRVYDTATGEVVYEQKKHTEWVTAAEFSPDGVLLASGDRNGGLVVWEAATGREFYDLRGHAAAITEVAWRLDSNLLASCSEDASVRLWEMQGGSQAKTWNPHGGAGTLGVRFAKDGRLATTGRDARARLWDQNGAQQREFEPLADLGIRVAFTFDDGAVVAGDWSGAVRLWSAADGQPIGNLAANPAPVAARLESARALRAEVNGAADAAKAELAALQASATVATEAMTATQTAFAAAEILARDTTTARAAAEQAYPPKAQAATDASYPFADAQSADYRAVEALSRATYEVALKADNERWAADTFSKTGTSLDATLLDRARAARTAAMLAVEPALAQLREVTDRLRTTRTAYDAAEALRREAEGILVAARAAADQAGQSLPVRKAELDQATAAKAAADAALAAKQPTAAVAIARAEALATEVRDLEAEVARAQAAQATTASASAATAPTR